MPTYRISKRFSFEAAHHLPHLPEGHKCRRPHGHSYQVEVHLASSRLNADGMVLDYAELDPFKRWIATDLDHHDLNEVLAPLLTTAENIAAYLWTIAERVLPLGPHVTLERVVVMETATTTASIEA